MKRTSCDREKSTTTVTKREKPPRGKNKYVGEPPVRGDLVIHTKERWLAQVIAIGGVAMEVEMIADLTTGHALEGESCEWLSESIVIVRELPIPLTNVRVPYKPLVDPVHAVTGFARQISHLRGHVDAAIEVSGDPFQPLLIAASDGLTQAFVSLWEIGGIAAQGMNSDEPRVFEALELAPDGSVPITQLVAKRPGNAKGGGK